MIVISLQFVWLIFPFICKDNADDCRCYAGLDEQLFYNAKYEVINDDDLAYSTYTG